MSQGKPSEARITFYYPGQTPAETIQVSDINWRFQGSCIAYTREGKDQVFCGTFRVVKAV
jgi:hypothetical protein